MGSVYFLCGKRIVETHYRVILLEVHDRVENLVQRIKDKHVEGALMFGRFLRLGPLFRLGIEEALSPEADHELLQVNLELGRVHLGKLLQRKGPAVETAAKSAVALGGVDLDVAHGAAVVRVGGDDDVDALGDAGKGLVEILLLQLEFEQRAVHLVHEEDGLDALGDGLPQHRLGLHAHTYKTKKKRLGFKI